MKRSISPAVLTAVLILAAAALLVLQLGGFLDQFQDALTSPLAPIQTWISIRFSAVRDMIASPRDIASLRVQNAELEAEVARLQREVITLQEEIAEAQILSALLSYARNQPDNRYIATEVIGTDTSTFLRSVWINGGTDDGLRYGMPVVTDSGLVGRLVEVRASISRVQLITDPDVAVNVRFQNSRADGLLQAQINGDINIELIPQDANIELGEIVLTSGLGGSFPADIPIGGVINVRTRDYELFQQASIDPNVDFDRLEIVLVITNFRALPRQNSSK
jgi:rod shape-determining protein MreC